MGIKWTEIDIISQFMCDRLGDTCQANDAAQAACMTATAATQGQVGQAAGKFYSPQFFSPFSFGLRMFAD
jgi:hypothetical protein